MIKRMISIILLLTSTTAFAADQSATIPNSRLLNEDTASARQKVDAVLQAAKDEAVVPVVIAGSLGGAASGRLKAIRVTENYKSIFEKIDSHLSQSSQRKETVDAWKFARQFLEDANNPSRWMIDETEEERDETRKLSWVSTEYLEMEFAKLHVFPDYSLRTINWQNFMENTAVNFLFGIYQSKQLLSEEGFTEQDKTAFRERLAAGRIFREWAYRHWDGSARLPSYSRFAAAGARLGRVSPEPVAEYYEAIRKQVEESAQADAQKLEELTDSYADGLNLLMSKKISAKDLEKRKSAMDSKFHYNKKYEFARNFFKQALDPSAWMQDEASIDKKETERFSRMSNEQLKIEFSKYHNFPECSLDGMTARIYLGDALPNFLYSLVWIREMGMDTDDEVFKKKLTAHRIFREWMYRHWNKEEKPATWTFFGPSLENMRLSSIEEDRQPSVAKANSLGTVVPLVLEKYYKEMMNDVRARVARARAAFVGAEEAYKKALRLLESKEVYVSADDVDMKWLEMESAEERLSLWQLAPQFFEKAHKPVFWMETENEEERKETRRFSTMTNEALEIELKKFHQFPDYTLKTINGKLLVGDTYLYLVHYADEIKADLKSRGLNPQDNIGWRNKMSAQRIFREWIYRHWDDQPKPASHTFFSGNPQAAANASSLGERNIALNNRAQAVVFQAGNSSLEAVVDAASGVIRSNNNKTVIFTVSQREKINPLRQALKARGITGKSLGQIQFEVNPLRSEADVKRFGNYVQGLRSKFASANDVAVIADFNILAGLNFKETLLIARDKAGQGSEREPADIANIRSDEREGTDFELFHLAWSILSSSGPEKFLDQIEQDASTGVFFIRLDRLKNLLEQWLSDHKADRQLQAAA